MKMPTMPDRAMQALYLLALDPVSETTADPNSYGFRRGRCTADAIEACFIALCRNDRAQWILEGDIRSCFDRISHEWLLTHIPMDKVILAKWLKAGYLENRRLFSTEEGTPQGGICSPVMANMALDGLERLLAAHFPKKGSPEKRAKVNLIRYADDFCIPGASKELLEQEVQGKWSGVIWFLEGDIRACFEEIDHEILVEIMRKKIKDERFLRLIRKFLGAGYMDIDEVRKDSLAGTPQGGIISPILANIYLHELDEYVEQVRAELEKGELRKPNPGYRSLQRKRLCLAQAGKPIPGNTKSWENRCENSRHWTPKTQTSYGSNTCATLMTG